MSDSKEIPSVRLQTLALVIQLVENEKEKMKKAFKEGKTDCDDDVWYYDLDQAATNLEEVYTHIIDTNKVSNFPKYDELIKRFK